MAIFPSIDINTKWWLTFWLRNIIGGRLFIHKMTLVAVFQAHEKSHSDVHNVQCTIDLSQTLGIGGENIPPCQPVTNLTSFVHRAAKMTDISGPWMEVNCILIFSPPRLQIFAVFSAPRRHSFLHRPPTGKIFVSQSGRKYLNERESIWLLSQPIYHFTSVYTMIEFSVYDRYRPCS